MSLVVSKPFHYLKYLFLFDFGFVYSERIAEWKVHLQGLYFLVLPDVS